jgi:mono/diheme cytochrome c family protein
MTSHGGSGPRPHPRHRLVVNKAFSLAPRVTLDGSGRRQGSSGGLSIRICARIGHVLGLALALLIAEEPAAHAAPLPSTDILARGEYLVRAGECFSCHTVPGSTPFAGGRALATPFGIFYSPNITPDRETGIGNWSDRDFVRALRKGVRPDGANYFPVFPYPSFTGISNEDALAIKAYLFSLAPVHHPNRAHEISFPFSWRFLQAGWKKLFFTKGPFHPDPHADAAANRGAYLVTALGHCGECHTPRNVLGAMRKSLWLAGTVDGPDDDPVPNITPDAKTGIGDWSVADIAETLKTGATPLDSKVKGAMLEVVADGTSHLTDADRQAIASYLKAQSPIMNSVMDEPEDIPWYKRIWAWLVSLVSFT